MNHDKHILFLTKWYPNPGDLQRGEFVRKYAMAAARHARVSVIDIQGFDHLEKKYILKQRQEDNINEFAVYFRNSPHRFRQVINIIRYFRAFIKCWSFFCRHSGLPTLVHAQVFLRSVMLACYLRLRYKIPYVITEHWTGFVHGAYRRKNWFYRWLCRYTLMKSEGISVVSPGLLDAILRNGLEHANVRVIPNVVTFRTPQPGFPGKATSTPLMLTVADLADYNKNISGSFRAIRKVLDRGFELDFHLIGGGKDEEKLRRLAAELDLRNITFHGRKDNEYVLEFMNLADFVLVNSRFETFSVVAAEALAAGKPLISTRCGGPEYFVDERCGILIPPDDEAALVAGIIKMLDEFRNYNSAYMRNHVMTRFSEQRVGEMLNSFYEEAVL